MSPAGLKVQGKQQIHIIPGSPLPYPIGYSIGGWVVGTQFDLHGLLPVPTQQLSYYAHRYIALN